MIKKTHVGLIFGGRSGEHEVSIASALSVYNALDKSRFDVTLIAIDKMGHWLLPEPAALLKQADQPMQAKLLPSSSLYGLVPFPHSPQLMRVEGEARELPKFDIILPIVHGTFGEDGTLQGLLELAQLPYVGSGVLGSALGMDKEVARRLLKAAGIPVVNTLCLRRSLHESNREVQEERIFKEFALPCFVKPANAGSSVGVHKVKTRDQLRAALSDAFLYDTKVLIEEGIDARELEVAVLGNDDPKASLVGEIIPHHEFYSYEAKYLDENGASYAIPAKNLSEDLIARVRQLAIETFQVLECRGMARIDFFLDRKTNQLYLNEVNTIPGFTKISMYPKLWQASGLNYAQLLEQLIEFGQAAHREKASLKTAK